METLVLVVVVSLIWGCIDWACSVNHAPIARPVVPATAPAVPPTVQPPAETPPATPTRPAVPPAEPPPPHCDPPADPPPTVEPTAEPTDDVDDDDPEAEEGPDDDVDDDCDDTIDDPDDDPDHPPVESAPDLGPCYDSDRCWGCPKHCTYRGFRIPGGSTADAIHRAASRAYRAEHGYDPDVDAADGDCGDWHDLPHEFNPIEIARHVGAAKRAAWFDMVDQCSTYVAAETAAGRDPWRPVVVDSASVDAEVCPF